jgi:undecaprenyl-diphosphatase
MRGDAAKPLTPAQSIAIGLAQCLALIPGTSHSGVTIMMVLLIGQPREHAARISFLIAIPAIGGAATIKLWDLKHTTITPGWFMLGIVPIVTTGCLLFYRDPAEHRKQNGIPTIRYL